MKKLLILGANYETIPLVTTAKSMGIYTIVTDYDINAPAKKVADRGIDIDGMDVAAIVEFCRKEGVDGVLVGVADRLIESYQQVCEILNLPCYGDKSQCEVLTNKEKFNDLCREYGILTIPSLTFFKNQVDYKHITYPAFIKPVDGNSGKGASIVDNEQELLEGLKKAFNNTKSNCVLVEKYMTCKDIFVSYTIVDGEPILSAMADRYTCKDQTKASQVCLGAVYPSNLLNLYMASSQHTGMIKMLKSLGLKNAILTISAFVEEDKFYYYDPGFRLQGEAPNLHMENITGFDQKRFLLDVALGNKISNTNITTADFKNKHAATIWFLLKKGIVDRVEGFDTVEKKSCIFYISRRLFEGSVISEDITGTEGQVMARIYLCCTTKTELQDELSKIQSILKVYDVEGNNQLHNGFVLKN